MAQISLRIDDEVKKNAEKKQHGIPEPGRQQIINEDRYRQIIEKELKG